VQNAQILTTIQKTASEIFGCEPEQFIESTTASDIKKWDSLRHLVFISALEQAFGVEFDVGAIAGLTNVGALVKMIAECEK
jgi:acyl carrier protein